ncbi:hypothetical protein LAZ67_18001073 [Cordylochernes scorpioides]|uniref:Mos1 transposase HTH domain-containing protein n=1 Tax=Cordylochernes scorpioides TaxID=51811 RepID=A0ABY6LJ73_9ARAC|nr:hypothetical protein LAZ67_18001073 [Cordylochernes scorpioides]
MLKILIGPWTTLEQDLTDWNKTLKFPRHLHLGDLPDLDALLADLKLAEFLLKMILGKNAQNVQKITDLIKENPRTTLLELEQDTGISKTTIGRIVTKDLKLKKTPAKFIPRFLTNEQKLCRLATCENMLEMTRTDPEWKDKIITGDETWVYDYDPETKRQYAEWRGQDIAPNDFFLFPKLKAVLKGRHFDTRDDIIEKSLLALKSIPKELYKNCFDNLGKRWRCTLKKRSADHETILESSTKYTGVGVRSASVSMELPLVNVSTCELRSVIRFFTAKNETAVNINRNLMSVYGDGCMSIQMVRRWRSWFLEGRQNVHDDERSGRPVTVTDNAAVAAVRNVVEADCRVTIDEIMIRLSPGIEIGRSSIGTIMSDVLNFRKVCARWVPRLLSENHKQQRMEAALDFLEMHRRDGDQLFSRIVTGDESWVHHPTPETKRQSMVWKKPEESTPKKAKVTISTGKVMAIVFGDCKGVLLVDYLTPNPTVNAARYCEVLTKLRAAIKRKRPALLSRKVLLVHDNARPRAAQTTQTLLENSKWEFFTHPPYSPDLAPSDFHLFPALKLHLGGKHFANDDEVQAEVNHWQRRHGLVQQWYQNITTTVPKMFGQKW